VWQITKDAEVASIVTQRAKADVLFAGHDGECAALCLDDPAVVSAIQSSPDSAVPADVTAALDANQLIYVIYTSGARALVSFLSFLFFSFLFCTFLTCSRWSAGRVCRLDRQAQGRAHLPQGPGQPVPVHPIPAGHARRRRHPGREVSQPHYYYYYYCIKLKRN
jgi:hypothetical protein